MAEFVRSIQSGSQLHRRKQLRGHKKRKRAEIRMNSMAILAGSALAGRLSVYLNVHIQTMNAICIHIDLNNLGPGNSTTEINSSPFPELF